MINGLRSRVKILKSVKALLVLFGMENLLHAFIVQLWRTASLALYHENVI